MPWNLDFSANASSQPGSSWSGFALDHKSPIKIPLGISDHCDQAANTPDGVAVRYVPKPFSKRLGSDMLSHANGEALGWPARGHLSE